MCASAPSLRVLFREYLSDTLSRIKRSVTSGRSRRDSDVEQVIIRRVDTPNERQRQQRMDFGAKKHMHIQHTPTSSDASAKFSEPMARVDAAQHHPPRRWEGEEMYSSNYSYQTSPAMLARALSNEEEGARASPQQFIVKTPEDFESYNLQNMERYRASAQRRSEEIARAMSASQSQQGRMGNEEQYPGRESEPEARMYTSRSWLNLGG